MGSTMQLGVSLFGPSMLLFALAPADLAGLAFSLMLFANGLGIAIHNVNQVTVRQVLTPDRLRARVMSVIRLLGYGAIPLGTLLGGVIGETVGLRAALVVSGLACLPAACPISSSGSARCVRSTGRSGNPVSRPSTGIRRRTNHRWTGYPPA
jgi:predicted MFS family arabinose efflux permease